MDVATPSLLSQVATPEACRDTALLGPGCARMAPVSWRALALSRAVAPTLLAFGVTTQRRKWAVAHYSLSLAHFFSFLFVLPTIKPNEIALLLQRLLNHGKLTKMYMLYKKELIYNLFLITNYPKLGFPPRIYKIQKIRPRMRPIPR